MAHLAIRTHLTVMANRLMMEWGKPEPTVGLPVRRLWWQQILLLIGLVVASAILLKSALAAGSARAHADTGAYLVEVTLRPGCTFSSAADAIAYGYYPYDNVSQAPIYSQLVGDIKSDFRASDEFQASYLIDIVADRLGPGAYLAAA